MMNRIPFALLILLFACSEPVKETEATQVENKSSERVDSAALEEPEESKTIIMPYIEPDTKSAALISKYLADNESKLSSPDTSQHLAYMTDYRERDGINYLTVQIGIDDEFRFATMQWLFIDTAKHQVYELDVVDDVLVPWP
ncbi:MAG: hypothetical protein EP332_10950 [Bacteroidetes bacterium]|nr:MAG: hypothetical protein EP332_10950 [Bacteroidota bacterium]